MSYICEGKKASPSKGLIAPDFPYLEIAKEYEAAGASAISCLTEPFYFRGADQYLKEITGSARIPVLRKAFTVDEYMIYQAKCSFGTIGSWPKAWGWTRWWRPTMKQRWKWRWTSAQRSSASITGI